MNLSLSNTYLRPFTRLSTLSIVYPCAARGFDWSEDILNDPNADYLLARQLRPDALPASPAAPPPHTPIFANLASAALGEHRMDSLSLAVSGLGYMLCPKRST